MASIIEKTGGYDGEAIFVARDIYGNILNTYYFSGRFVYYFFDEMYKYKGKDIKEIKVRNYNFGCARCDKCKSYHRLDKLKRYERRFVSLGYKWKDEIKRKGGRGPAKNMKPLLWDDIYDEVSAQCK